MALIAQRAAIFLAFCAGFAIPTSTALIGLSVGLLFGVAALPVFVHDWRGSLRNPFVAACVGFWLWYALSTLWSSASPEAPNMLMKLYPFAIAPALYAVCLQPSVRLAVVAGFGIGATASVLISVSTAVLGTPLLNGTVGNWVVFHNHIYHNLFAGVLALALIAGLLARRWPAWVAAGAALLAALTIFDMFFLVQGRTGQVVFVVLVVVLALLWNLRRGLVATLMALLVALPLIWNESAVVQERFTRALDEARGYVTADEAYTSVGMRLSWYESALAIIAEAPLLGHGSGALTDQFRRRAPAAHPETHLIGPGKVRNPHNSYLWVGVETGLVGIAALLAVFAGALFSARRLPSAQRWTASIAVGALAVGSLANSFIMDRPTGTGFIVLLCALLAGPMTWRASGSSPDTR